MAQRKPSRKKRRIQAKPEKFHPLNRAVRKRIAGRRIERQKAKTGNKDRKAVLVIVICFLIAVVILILLYHYQTVITGTTSVVRTILIVPTQRWQSTNSRKTENN